MTHDSSGHLKALCMSILLVSGGIESEWKHYRPLLSFGKTLAFYYESNFNFFVAGTQTSQNTQPWKKKKKTKK